MEVVEIPCEFDALWLSDADTRTPGLHLSDVLRDLGNTLGMTDYRDDTDFSQDPVRAAVSLGFIWENFISTQLRDTAEKYASGLIFRPPEIERDGIICSPDAFDMTLPGLREFKCTSKSSRTDIRDEVKFWSWWMQIKCYCHVLEIDQAILQVFWLSTNWDPGHSIRAYHAKFGQTELNEAWSQVVKHAR